MVAGDGRVDPLNQSATSHHTIQNATKPRASSNNARNEAITRRSRTLLIATSYPR